MIIIGHASMPLNNFELQAKLLMRVHHKNLVRLVGYCNDGTNMALIYEYMSNGNLRQRLSGITIFMFLRFDHLKLGT